VSAPRHPLNASRFRALAETFGGDIGRWPEAEQEVASAWRAAHPREAASVLKSARALDDLLGAWQSPAPAETLRGRILDAAPAVVRSARRRALVLTLGGGAGLAAACLAGILVAPVLLSAPALRPTSSSAISPPALTNVQMEEVLTEALAGWEAPVAGSEADSGA
jgi:hypothetical protein